MTPYSREVDVDEFLAHLTTGAEAREYDAHFGHYGPKADMRDYDPASAPPQGLDALPALDPDEDEPLC